MKIAELLLEEEIPLIVIMLRKLLAAGKPVFYVTPRDGILQLAGGRPLFADGILQLLEIYRIDDEIGRFSPTAPGGIGGTPFTGVWFKAPNYLSWKTDDIGSGRGDGTFGLPHIKAEDYIIKKLPSFEGRKDYVFGLANYVNRWERERADK